MILKNRTYLSIILSGLLIILTAGIRKHHEAPNAGELLRAERFWIMKAQNKAKYNLLIVGDSRSYRGVNPAEMAKTLQGLKMYNFGFSSGSLNPEIYEAAEKLLDTVAQKKIILLGIAPGTLTGLYEGNRQYNEEHNRPLSAYFERVYINMGLYIFRPFDFVESFSNPKSQTNPSAVYISDYHDNGWVGSYKHPEDTAEALSLFRREFEQYKVKPELLKALLDQTREWTAKGIQVFGFRPPTSRDMQNLENEISGFDEKTFVKEFEAAGGKWIPVDLNQYHSFDGTHIDEPSAEKLSDYLAKEIAKHEQP